MDPVAGGFSLGLRFSAGVGDGEAVDLAAGVTEPARRQRHSWLRQAATQAKMPPRADDKAPR